MNRILIVFIILCTFCQTNTAQQKLTLQQYEDSIQNQFDQLLTLQNDTLNSEINKKVIQLFKEVLSNSNSFTYAFEKLKNISKLNAADGNIRIINWNLPLQNGEFQYFGFIQHFDNIKKEVKLYELTDKSGTIKEPATALLTDNNWFGALYYKILTTKWNKTVYYTLLGWDGNNNFTNKKIIDLFYIKDNKVVFGPPIFKMEKGIQNRLIFEYSKQAKMMLKYDEKLDIIVWDHLAPSQPNFVGQYMYYGPDLSQDGVQFIDGYWVLKPNLDLRNMEKSTGKSIKKSF